VSAPVHPHLSRARRMPATAAARLDDIQATLGVLEHERSRFERLGFELPLARCHAEIRYWSFLASIHALPADADQAAPPIDGPAWPGPPVR
jgi:hypothetical protein